MRVRIVIVVCFVLLIGVPLLFRPAQSQTGGNGGPAGGALELIIITPHNEQIRYEFGRAFDEWHRKTYGQRVNVIWNVPGGTSEIRRMLEAQFTAALETGRPSGPGGDADMVFGGGSFEFGRMKKGVHLTINGIARDEPITAPVEFTDEWLKQTYGENRIGEDPLYDKDKYWFGVALSGFGIVYNRDNLAQLGVSEPMHWSDLCDPRLQSWLALVNPAQSGSVTTAFESILKRSGWEQGWRILHRAGANSRYFSGSSLKPPIDVSQGNAAMGVCIDFYGRYQSQAMKEAGDPNRIGYIDPPDGSTIDSDPIAMLRNAPHTEVARHFIEFCLSDAGQALWQFRKRSAGSTDDLGPERFELRRLPIKRALYEKYFDRFIDNVNPYTLAKPVEYPNPNFRDFIAPMFAAMVMDNHRELKRAWNAIVSHPAYPSTDGMISPRQVTDAKLRTMIKLFDQMPVIAGPKGAQLSLADATKLGEIRGGWLKREWAGQGLWNPQSTPIDEMRWRFAEFFRANYRQIIRLAEQ